MKKIEIIYTYIEELHDKNGIITRFFKNDSVFFETNSITSALKNFYRSHNGVIIKILEHSTNGTKIKICPVCSDPLIYEDSRVKVGKDTIGEIYFWCSNCGYCVNNEGED